MTARGAAALLRDFLLPRRCPGCGGCVALDDGAAALCARCRLQLRPLPSPRCPRCDAPLGTGRTREDACLHCRTWPASLADARALTLMEPPASGLVHALKYGDAPELGPFMGRRMAAALRPPEGALIGWIPTSPRRHRRRGYDQAELLARAYADAAGAPVEPLLRRVRDTPSQIALPPERRQQNVAGALGVAGSPVLAHRPVVLVDDVLTTGATAGEAARTLERAGAWRVSVVTFARSLPDPTARG